MGGILKNPLPKEEHTVDYPEEDLKEFRQRVFTNTQLNAKLTQGKRKSSDLNKNLDSEELSTKKNSIPKDTLSLKHEKDILSKQDSNDESEANNSELQWNQKNLAENEIAKLKYQDIHVDEPKTPYQGAMDPQGEYYIDDDDDGGNINNDDNELTAFSLGEPQIELPELSSTANQENERIDDSADNENLDQESKHKKFDELRKKHYNMKEFFHNR